MTSCRHAPIVHFHLASSANSHGHSHDAGLPRRLLPVPRNARSGGHVDGGYLRGKVGGGGALPGQVPSFGTRTGGGRRGTVLGPAGEGARPPPRAAGGRSSATPAVR